MLEDSRVASPYGGHQVTRVPAGGICPPTAHQLLIATPTQTEFHLSHTVTPAHTTAPPWPHAQR